MTSSANTTNVPYDFCTQVSAQCPVENTIYGYYPSVGANAFFVGFFFMCGAMQLYAGIRYKTWTYLVAMFLACLDQGIGYIGRVMLHQNPWSSVGFQIQICCLILGPAFNSAAIYLVLKHVVLCFGPEYSHLKPKWYTWIFICGDLLSLVIQAIGGGMAATSMDNESRQEVGDHLMLAGIAFQVVTLTFFAVAAGTYLMRRRRAHQPLSSEAHLLVRKLSFQMFAVGVPVAFAAIFIRCVYRIVEMSGGWGNPIMQAEAPFIALDGRCALAFLFSSFPFSSSFPSSCFSFPVLEPRLTSNSMVALATLIQTLLHPGWCFPRLSSAYVPPVSKTRPSSTSSTPPEPIEMGEEGVKSEHTRHTDDGEQV